MTAVLNAAESKSQSLPASIATLRQEPINIDGEKRTKHELYDELTHPSSAIITHACLVPSSEGRSTLLE